MELGGMLSKEGIVVGGKGNKKGAGAKLMFRKGASLTAFLGDRSKCHMASKIIFCGSRGITHVFGGRNFCECLGRIKIS